MYFKVLNDDGTGIYSHTKWALPRQGRDGITIPGRWMPEISTLMVCESGYHLTDEAHLVEWLGPVIYVAEGRGATLDGLANGDSKTVFVQARLLRKLDTWNAKTARLFAADVAEHVLPIWEARFPDGPRARDAITVARRCANGQATEGELKAACNVAYTAANAAIYLAARAAAYDVSDAARAAAYAAYADERKWQTTKLMEYLSVP